MTDFLYGAATSAHQVEGNNVHNDWWAWERANPSGEPSGRATDHYNRFKEDFALAKSLGHNAHRFSIEWSRIEPRQGEWDKREIEHYRAVLSELRRLGLTSFVTLWHFTNPKWLQNGWLSRETPALFAEYADVMARELGDLVDFWITVNEPVLYAGKAFWEGSWPPQKHSGLATLRVVKNLARGHRLAYRAIHNRIPEARVGMAKHAVVGLPRWQDWWFHRRWFSVTKKTHDFIGVNYYKSVQPAGREKSDMGWVIAPEGLTEVLLNMKRYQKPIYVTENGVADARDQLRADFIRDHLRAVEKAQEQGADVRGYLHWSLLDNFEWVEGYTPRFGLVEVDYKTMERQPRPSAYVYQAIIEQATTSPDSTSPSLRLLSPSEGEGSRSCQNAITC